MIARIPVVLALLFSAIAQAGILVSRTDKGLQFSEAASITINGKDKALNMGSQPRLSGPINKLPNVKLGGTLLNDAMAKIVALDEDGNLTYLLPEGLPKNAPNAPAEIWKATNISYKKTASDKSQTPVSAGAFVAWFSGGTEELARACKDARLLEILGGKGKAFATQMEFMTAVVKAYPADPEVATLERYVEQAMRLRYEKFESGTATLETLKEGLTFAELSEAAYPSTPAQQQLRRQLRERSAWLDRKIAVLRAFEAAKDWDAFLLADRDFEKYQQAFPDIEKKQLVVLQRSLDLHKELGEDRLKEREFGSAYREFLLASARKPSDNMLQSSLAIAWTDYSNERAEDRGGKRKQLSAGERAEIDRALLYARRDKEAGKLDQALKDLQDAAAVDAQSLEMLLTKAEVLGARREFKDAMAVLDQYDMIAVKEERDKAVKLRNELKYERSSTVGDMKGQIGKLWTGGDFNKVYSKATEGLLADADDADLLYNAGVAAAVVRKPKEARKFFTHYLEVANSLDTNPELRVKVRALLPTIQDLPPEGDGPRNWMSGRKAEKGVYYDPVSLAFQPHIERVDAGKLKVSFEWDGDRLKAIVPTFEKNERPTGERKLSFAYADQPFPRVDGVGYEDGAQSIAATDPDELYKKSAVVVLNNPYVNPLAVQQFANQNVSLAIAGNRFFEPFVWEKIHYFRLTYDSAGRVAQAREVADPKSAPGDSMLEFEWDGAQLVAIYGYTGHTRVYERDMQYHGDQLVSEEIRSQGRTAHIKYNYNGGRLVSANCEKDTTLDERSRNVTFQ